MVEWDFLFAALKQFNLDPTFITWIKLLYTNIFSCTTNNGYLSKRFPLSRGIRQGCPISALLFCQLRYFAPFLKPRQSVYNTRKSQADGVFLEIPHFATSLYKSSKHFGLSFAYDTPKIWNNLPDDVHSATYLHSFRRKLKVYLFAQAYPPWLLLSLISLRGADPCYISGLWLQFFASVWCA